MKTMYKTLFLFMGLFAFLFTSCEKEDETPTLHKPVVDTDFTVTVNGNTVLFNCSMKAATSFLWELGSGDQSNVNPAEFYVPMAGTYWALLSVSDGGDFLTSDTVEFTIATTDVAVFQSGIWKNLTGGPNVQKTWKLDVGAVVTVTIDDAGTETSTSVNKASFFHNPLDFYGDKDAGHNNGASWGPWGGTSIYDWGGTPETGSIRFDAITGICTLVLEGETTTGKYTFKPFDRYDAFCDPAIDDNGTAITLWQHMLKYKYSYLGVLSAQMGDLKFASGMRFPMDKGRITNDANVTHPNQFLTEDLENVTILHCSDSALVVRVKRSFEGDGDSKCWLLYNYVVDGYTYTAPTYTHPVRTDVTTATLAGTWKPATIPYNWIGWSGKNLLNTWTSAADIIATGWAGTAESLAADDAIRVSFETNGSCNINGLATTYTINKGGYIAFADSVTIPTYMCALKGKYVYAVNVTESTDGIWLGQNNGTKSETSAVHLVKVQ
jgi:hypothetical protein